MLIMGIAVHVSSSLTRLVTNVLLPESTWYRGTSNWHNCEIRYWRLICEINKNMNITYLLSLSDPWELRTGTCTSGYSLSFDALYGVPSCPRVIVVSAGMDFRPDANYSEIVTDNNKLLDNYDSGTCVLSKHSLYLAYYLSGPNGLASPWYTSQEGVLFGLK